MPPKQSAEVLSSFPKYKDALMCLTGEKCVLERLHPGMSYIAIGHEFSVMYWSVYENSMTRGSQAPNFVYPLGAVVQ